MHKQIYDSVGFNMIQHIRWVQICSSIQNMLLSSYFLCHRPSCLRCLLVAITCWQPLSINTWLTMNVAQNHKIVSGLSYMWAWDMFHNVASSTSRVVGRYHVFRLPWSYRPSVQEHASQTGRNASDVGQQFGNANAAGNHVCLFGSVWWLDVTGGHFLLQPSTTDHHWPPGPAALSCRNWASGATHRANHDHRHHPWSGGSSSTSPGSDPVSHIWEPIYRCF